MFDGHFGLWVVKMPQSPARGKPEWEAIMWRGEMGPIIGRAVCLTDDYGLRRPT